MSEAVVEAARGAISKLGLPEDRAVAVGVRARALAVSGLLSVRELSLLNVDLGSIVKTHPAVVDRVNLKDVKLFRRRPDGEEPMDKEKAKVWKYSQSPNDEDLTEYFDSDSNLATKVGYLAALIKAAKHVVVYTGAGLSTAAKIPDFRGKDGIWTARDRGDDKHSEGLRLEMAQPTYSHYALVELLQKGLVHFIVSQNIDGLHRKSGVRQDQIAEIHGNSFKEVCAECKKEFLRDFDVCAVRGEFFKGVRDKLSQSGLSHITGRKCDDCGGILRDTIVHFKESLPEDEVSKANAHAKLSDLSIAIGTSLRVRPACDLPELAHKQNNGCFVVINLQATGKDEESLRSGGVLINHRIDVVFELLMKALELDFPRKSVPEDEKAFHFEKDHDIPKESTSGPKAKIELAKPAPSEFYLHSFTKDGDSGKIIDITFSTKSDSVETCNFFIEKIEVLNSKEEIVSTCSYGKENDLLISVAEITEEIHLKVYFKEEYGLKVSEVDYSHPADVVKNVKAIKTPKKQMGGGLLAALQKGTGLKAVKTKVATASGDIVLEDESTRKAAAEIAAAKSGRVVKGVLVAEPES